MKEPREEKRREEKRRKEKKRKEKKRNGTEQNRTEQNRRKETFGQDEKEEPEKREAEKRKKRLFQAILRSLSKKKISFLTSPWSLSTNSSAPSCLKSAKFLAKSSFPLPSYLFYLLLGKEVSNFIFFSLKNRSHSE